MPLTSSTINTRIKNRTDTTSNWTTVNPILEKGEIGFEDTGSEMKFKVGDGISHWNSLDYVATPDEIQIGNIEPTKYKLWINPDEAADDEIQISSTEPQKYKVWINPEDNNDGNLTAYAEFLFKLDQSQQIVNYNNITYNDIMQEFLRNSHIAATIIGTTNSQKTIFPLVSHIDSFIFGNVVNNAFYTIEINNSNNISFNQIPLGKNYTGGNGIVVDNINNIISSDLGTQIITPTKIFELNLQNFEDSDIPTKLFNIETNDDILKDENDNEYPFNELRFAMEGDQPYIDPTKQFTLQIYDINENLLINENILFQNLDAGEDVPVYIWDPYNFITENFILDQPSAELFSNWNSMIAIYYMSEQEDGYFTDNFYFCSSTNLSQQFFKIILSQDKIKYKGLPQNTIKPGNYINISDDSIISVTYGQKDEIVFQKTKEFYGKPTANNKFLNNLYCFSYTRSSRYSLSPIDNDSSIGFSQNDDKDGIAIYLKDKNETLTNVDNYYPHSSTDSDYYYFINIQYKKEKYKCKEIGRNDATIISNTFSNIFYDDVNNTDSYAPFNDAYTGYYVFPYNTNDSYTTILTNGNITPVDSDEDCFYLIVIVAKKNSKFVYCPIFLTTNSKLDFDKNNFQFGKEIQQYKTLPPQALCYKGASLTVSDAFIAMGEGCISDGNGSIAIGKNNQAKCDYTVSLGVNNINSCSNSIIGGTSNTLTGSGNSLIVGSNNKGSSCNNTFLLGNNLQSDYYTTDCLIVGKYNSSLSGSFANFIVGVGDSEGQRDNALEIGKNLYVNGNYYRANINGKLHVNDSVYINGDLTINGDILLSNDSSFSFLKVIDRIDSSDSYLGCRWGSLNSTYDYSLLIKPLNVEEGYSIYNSDSFESVHASIKFYSNSIIKENKNIYQQRTINNVNFYYKYIDMGLFQNLQPLSSSATLAEAITAYNDLLAILKGA